VSTASRTMAAAAFVSLLTIASFEACAAPNPNDITEIDAPPYDQFSGEDITSPATQAGVSRVLEKRCGTLDCHGQVGRAMRIYGVDGLRFVEADSQDQPGQGSTTPTELEANYQSVIGLQPEIMSLVHELQLPPEALMLLRKPLQLERHKGGAVFVSGDDAYTCITSWLASGGDAGTTDYTSCYNASQ
jgi:hypothetical protein